MVQPYIYTIGPDIAYKKSGTAAEAIGFHAYFVTHVPFIPSFLSNDFTRMITGDLSRIKLIVRRQIRFLNDLCSCRSENYETIDLRFVSIPQPDQPYNKLYIFFIGKVFHPDINQAKILAIGFWQKFASYFPLEDPFNFPLRTITALESKDGKELPSDPDLLDIAMKPLSGSTGAKGQLVEIRKYEDRDPMLISGDTDLDDQFIGYFPHPFSPTLDYSAMSRFLETFTKQDQICVASICLRPTTLFLEEQQQINRMMQHYWRLFSTAEESKNWLALYRGERLDDIKQTFKPLVNQRNHLFVVKIQILGSHTIPEDVVAALGSEIMNNTTPEPRMWIEAIPQDDEERSIAIKNFYSMEFRPWRRGNLDHPLWRLSSLVTTYEAVGAFRLPVPPESGHMPGINVRDEPFVMPAELNTEKYKKIKDDIFIPIGKIIHRGTITDTDFNLSLSSLKRHGLITGSTGSGKTNTCLFVLTQLWKKAHIPFLVIYPIDKPDYRVLSADKNVRDDLLVFTLGDDTTSPFRFNPLHVPKGILVRTHISLLMRAFSAAFSMWDPLPAVYRAALRKLYKKSGYHDLQTAKGGDSGTSDPLLSAFYEELIQTAEEMTADYGKEAKGTIRQGSEIRIHDLLQTAGSVLNVQEGIPWDEILKHPTVMEIGRVGSTEDSALVMGFLLMSLTSHLASRRKTSDHSYQHVTLIEEAHRLMSSSGIGVSEFTGNPRAKASEDFANILAEVRGFNESILIAEQIPTELVSGAIGNTYIKIMHWLEEQRSFELFAEVMNLNQQQREYARTLDVGWAIVRGANARPILVKITDYLNQFQNPDDSLVIDDTDEAIHTFMLNQVEKFKIQIPDPVALFEDISSDEEKLFSPASSAPIGITPGRSNSWLFSIPMQTCVYCEMMNRTNKCKYIDNIRGKLALQNPHLTAKCDPMIDIIAKENEKDVWRTAYTSLEFTFMEAFIFPRNAVSEVHLWGHFYCFLAHRFNKILSTSVELKGSEGTQVKARVKEVLLWAQARVKTCWDPAVMQP